MSEKEIVELREKILSGIALTYQRLVKQKSKNYEELVFLLNEKIVKVKVRVFPLY